MVCKLLSHGGEILIPDRLLGATIDRRVLRMVQQQRSLLLVVVGE